MRLSFVSRSSLRWFLSVAVCCLCWSASVVPQLWRSGCSLRVSSGSLSGLWRYSYKECYGRAKVLKGRHLEHRPVGPHLMFFDFLMSFNSLSPVRTLLCAADATFSLILSSTPHHVSDFHVARADQVQRFSSINDLLFDEHPSHSRAGFSRDLSTNSSTTWHSAKRKNSRASTIAAHIILHQELDRFLLMPWCQESCPDVTSVVRQVSFCPSFMW